MDQNTVTHRPPASDWPSVSDEELAAYSAAENRYRASRAARSLTGDPDAGASITWKELALPARRLPVRVYRPTTQHKAEDPAGEMKLPLVLHVHGGGFVGTAVQSDWVNSYLAAHMPAVVISVEHRLLSLAAPLPTAVGDLWDVLEYAIEHPAELGIDPARIAVFGESCGALISALAAIRAARTGVKLLAQVLVNPVTDVSASMFAYPSMSQFAHTPTLSVEALQLIQRLAVPAGIDAHSLSPLHADDVVNVAPTLVIIPTDDPLADQGRCYAERLRSAGVATQTAEFPRAGHAFLSLPAVAPQALPAKGAIHAFLRSAMRSDGDRGVDTSLA